MATHTVAITFTSGTIIYASNINRNYSDFQSTINNLNSANIITSGVDVINLNASAVTTAKVADEVYGHMDLFMEVFS